MTSRTWALHHSCVAVALWVERNLVEVSIAVGLSGDGPKEPPRCPGCNGSIHFVQFLPLIDVNQRGLSSGANSGPNHNRLWILTGGARRRQTCRKPRLTSSCMSFWWLLVHSMMNSLSSVNRIRSQFRGVTRRSSRRHLSSRSLLLSAVRSWTLNLELVWLELKLLFGYSEDRFALDTGFTGNFSHRHWRISLDALFHELTVPICVDCALSAWNRLITLLTFVGVTPSFRTMSQLLIPCSCNTKILSRWLCIYKITVQFDKQFCKQIMNVVLLSAQSSCDESERLRSKHSC